jgi:hypothetical protein
MSNKTKSFYSNLKESAWVETHHSPVFTGSNESARSPHLPPAAVKWQFFAKKSKKIKKVLDKPARILYSPAVNKNQ